MKHITALALGFVLFGGFASGQAQTQTDSNGPTIGTMKVGEYYDFPGEAMVIDSSGKRWLKPEAAYSREHVVTVERTANGYIVYQDIISNWKWEKTNINTRGLIPVAVFGITRNLDKAIITFLEVALLLLGVALLAILPLILIYPSQYR